MKVYTTFKDAVAGYIKEKSIHKVEQKNLLKDFALFLDGFQVADAQFQIAALKGARKMDKEIIIALIDEIGMERSTEIVRLIANKHRHYSQWQDKNSGKLGKAFSFITWNVGKILPKARSWGLSNPTEHLPADKQKDLDDVRKNTKSSE